MIKRESEIERKGDGEIGDKRREGKNLVEKKKKKKKKKKKRDGIT